MYRKRFVLAAVVSSTLIGILGMVVYAQRVPTKRTKPRGGAVSRPQVVPKGILGPAALPNKGDLTTRGLNSPNTASWSVAVDFTLKLDPETKALLYQQMTSAISGYTAVPNDRLNYYSAVNNPPNWVIGGMGRVGTGRRARSGRGLSGDSLGRSFFLRVAPRDADNERRRLLGAVLRRCKQYCPLSRLPRSESLGRSGADVRGQRLTLSRRKRDGRWVKNKGERHHPRMALTYRRKIQRLW